MSRRAGGARRWQPGHRVVAGHARVTLQQNATLTNAAVGLTSGLTVTTDSGTSRVTIPQGDGESALPAERMKCKIGNEVARGTLGLIEEGRGSQ